jgi:hypothetical protein
MELRIMNENLRRCALVAAVAICAVGSSACVNKKEVNKARTSVYDAEFATVYSATVKAVRELYPELDEDPAKGVIKTAWHQVKYTDPGADDPKSVQSRDRTAGAGQATPANAGGLGYNPSLARRMTFIRFDVYVAGVRPYRVRVVGTASELQPGNALPTELRGQAKPHWLAGRTDALHVAIYRKLKRFAEPAPPEVVEVPVEAPRAKISGEIAEGARTLAQDVIAAVDERNYDELRALCAPDVVWSLGASPGVEGAMAMWQADPSVFAQMKTAIAAGCATEGEDVVCPATVARGAMQLRLAKRDGIWRIAAFVPRE